ncbi:MAG: aconitate hydratase, partial [Planctomycetes bacterium]|nr:aconitate hydratase [Planctomycetota bacterium]
PGEGGDIGGGTSASPPRGSEPLPPAAGGSYRLEAPPPAPELPALGFVRDAAGFLAPPPDGARTELEVAAGSERLQLLAPFDPWDGKDLVELPLLLKVRGKCTTDHISPAGPWLRYRGHLDRISDNLFLGAVNAFSGQAGTTRDLVTGEAALPVPRVARAYRAAGLRWVVVGDHNYGEGSSREHAAMSPRHLGGAAILARSFARIHESNLKKQGVLPLTLAVPADYDRVEEEDRLSVLGLAGLAPGRPLVARLHHRDGRTEDLGLAHSLSSEQIAWFRAGSALNVLRRGAKRSGGG